MSSLDFFCIPRVGSLTGAFKIKSIVSLRLPVNSFHECEPLKQQTIFIMPDQPNNSSSSSEDRFISDFSSLHKIISSARSFFSSCSASIFSSMISLDIMRYTVTFLVCPIPYDAKGRYPDFAPSDSTREEGNY